ncbi:GAF domain-containing protein [Pseudomonas matsuisoli]|uniref:histidine kinase n=1 Tax=Pseudomonas matsuisoli TaxID=1515666 RepID=A0A917PU63_9PSED|nr:GAF domain-containing protein [Pseudomonas matsuisoli]GGJ91791.1 bacteriophytochrome [Pseudomonas matsuisoli]
MNQLSVNLTNCEDEPIHTPRSIQPHGALLIVDEQRRLLSKSANFLNVTTLSLQTGATLLQNMLDADIHALIEEAIRAPTRWENSAEVWIGDQLFDVVGHKYLGLIYLEFEPRESGTASFTEFALSAQRIIRQMQLHDDLHTLLTNVVTEVRRMTGFDRIMAYRFNSDLSGEVVAEARRDDLVSYLGQRYPASDIPAQARRLYIQNPIRMIVDVAYEPSRMEPSCHPDTQQEFDMSLCALRSVSPIHCEYLTNMGVHASMSISLVVDGQLWGLFSCHHMTPKHLSHPIRMFFQIISQASSAIVQRLEATQHNAQLHAAAERRNGLMLTALESDDLLQALGQGETNMAKLLDCDAAVAMLGGRLVSIGGECTEQAYAVVDFLKDRDDLEAYQTDAWPTADAEQGIEIYPGVMAIRFHKPENGWIVWFRRENIRTIRWGGKPEKNMKVGPLGPRLTPRGSFEAWEEVVRGRSRPWTEVDIQIANALRRELIEYSLHRASEVDEMRRRLIAVLGHDLRNPLQSISMAASMLSADDARTTELRKHITHSSGRMERLIMQILDMSRLQAGLGITVNKVPTDLSELVSAIAAESDMAFRGTPLECTIQPDVRANIDPDRYAQLIANLLSNARQHGLAGHATHLHLHATAGEIALRVCNYAPLLPASTLQNMFVPFKQFSPPNAQNRGGLGIGLYICHAIAVAHGGTLTVEQRDDGLITFTQTLVGG